MAHPAEFRLALTPEPQAGANARQAIRDRYSPTLSAPVLSDLLTVVSELVNNAVKHGPGRPINISVAMGAESIRGEVSDQGNPKLAIPKIRKATEDPDSGGLGLNLVDRMTAGWAVYEGSTHVWFEIPLGD